jgi:hypothetical protein
MIQRRSLVPSLEAQRLDDALAREEHTIAQEHA